MKYRMFFTTHQQYGLGTRSFEADSDEHAMGKALSWAKEHDGNVSLYRSPHGEGRNEINLGVIRPNVVT